MRISANFVAAVSLLSVIGCGKEKRPAPLEYRSPEHKELVKSGAEVSSSVKSAISVIAPQEITNKRDDFLVVKDHVQDAIERGSVESMTLYIQGEIHKSLLNAQQTVRISAGTDVKKVAEETVKSSIETALLNANKVSQVSDEQKAKNVAKNLLIEGKPKKKILNVKARKTTRKKTSSLKKRDCKDINLMLPNENQKLTMITKKICK